MKPGDRLHGRFELVAPMGSGGVSTVWHAREGDRDVALKVLHPHLRDDRVVRERLRREASILSSISHAAVPRAFAVVEDGDGLSISMELVRGPTLKERILAGGPLPIDEVKRVARELLGALSAAHAAGVVHRDVKPQNVVLAGDRPRILDFGFARVEAAAGLTARSLVVGTPEYAAPEQIEGRPVDGRADLYSLGVVLFEAITGRLPFRGGTPYELLRQHLSAEVPPLSGIRGETPPDLDAFVARLLRKKPEDRFSTCEEALRALDEPAPERARASATCASCGSPREPGWPLCPSCGASDEGRAAGEWMVLLIRVPEGDAAPALREVVRSVGAEPGHELAAGSPEATARLPKVVLKGLSEPLAKLVRERALPRDLQVEIRRAGKDLDLLYSRVLPSFVFAGGALGLWAMGVALSVRAWSASWQGSGAAIALSAIPVALSLALGPAVWAGLQKHASRFLPPLATIPPAAARVPIPAQVLDRYRAALEKVRDASLRGTLARVLERALAIQEAARTAPDHLLAILEEPRAAAHALVGDAADLAIAAQSCADRLERCAEGEVRDEIAALVAKKADPELIEAKEAALREIGELERTHAATMQRLLRTASALELATVRLLAASAPDAAQVTRELDRLSLQSDAALRTAKALSSLR